MTKFLLMSNQSSSLEFSHFPVMLNEVLKISSPESDKKHLLIAHLVEEVIPKKF